MAAPVESTLAALADDLAAYAPGDEHERAMAARIRALLVEQPQPFARTPVPPGHITASAWIVDASRTRTLLTHHRKLDRWLQLGGHADGDADVRRVAMREAREESGLASLRFVSPAIYDLDVHAIPERGSDLAHEHFDIRFALEADPLEPFVVSSESHALAWVEIADLASYGADESVLRLARKTAALG